jgi:hypothetical protein
VTVRREEHAACATCKATPGQPCRDLRFKHRRAHAETTRKDFCLLWTVEGARMPHPDMQARASQAETA